MQCALADRHRGHEPKLTFARSPGFSRQGVRATAIAENLLAMKTPREQVREAFLSVLGREPDADERAEAEAHLASRRDRPAAGVQELLWALLAGAEFRFNH